VEVPCLLRRGGVRQLLTSGPIDLGERFSGETVAMEIPVRVRGAGGALRVSLQAPELAGGIDLSRSCEIEKAPAELQPRHVENVRVQVRVPIGLKPGPYGGTVAFDLAGGPQGDALRVGVQWRVRVKAPELTVQPTWLNVGSLKPGESRSANVRVATRGGRAMVQWGLGSAAFSPAKAFDGYSGGGLAIRVLSVGRLEWSPPWDADDSVALRLVNWKERGEELEVTAEGVEVEVVATARKTATSGGRVRLLRFLQPDSGARCAMALQTDVRLQWLQLDGQLQFGSVEAGDATSSRLAWRSSDVDGAPDVPVDVRVRTGDTPAVRTDWASEGRGSGLVTLRTDRQAVRGSLSGWLEMESATALARRACTSGHSARSRRT
jgi:hypothetical protein